MKKIAKTIFTLLCCLFVLFLLLPFIFPDNGLKKNGPDQQEVSEPQIFTSNPLTKLVQSLARIFSRGRATAPAPATNNERLSQAQANRRFGTVIASAKDISGNSPSNSTETQPENNSLGNTDSYQPEAEEWVLIQQTMPEGGVSGMHEINIKDDAYDRYVKYERNARFTPSQASRAAEKDVPDSKLARFFQPIKNFFGFGDSEQNNAFEGATASVDRAAQTGESEGLGNLPEHNLARFRAPSYDNIRFNMPNAANAWAYNPQATLFDTFNPYRSVDQMTDLLADTKYPDPLTPEEEKQKQEYTEAQRREIIEMVDNWLLSNMEEKAMAETNIPDNIIVKILNGCQGAKGAFLAKGDEVCSSEEPDASGEKKYEETKQQLQDFREANKAYFLKNLPGNLPLEQMPELPITLVLGKADKEDTLNALEQFKKSLSEEKEDQRLMADKYMFMLNQAQCSDENPCFWVGNANSTDQNSQEPHKIQGPQDSTYPLLANTLYAGNMKATPRPNVTDPLDEGFAAQQAQNETDPQKREELEKKARETQTSYILLTGQQLKDQQEANKRLLMTKDVTALSKGSFLVTSSATAGLDVVKAVDSPLVIFENNNNPLDSQGTAKTRSKELLTGPLAFAKSLHDKWQEIKKDTNHQALAQAISNEANKATAQINNVMGGLTKKGTSKKSSRTTATAKKTSTAKTSTAKTVSTSKTTSTAKNTAAKTTTAKTAATSKIVSPSKTTTKTVSTAKTTTATAAKKTTTTTKSSTGTSKTTTTVKKVGTTTKK